MKKSYKKLTTRIKKTVIGITGKSGSGKTKLCQKIIEIVIAENGIVAGVISPAVIINKEKVGIVTKNLSNGEERILTQIVKDDLEIADLGIWKFNQETIAWVESYFGQIETCDLLVLDEIGPLEFESKRGWVRAFSDLERIQYRMVLITFRPKYIETMRERYPSIKIISACDKNAMSIIMNDLSLNTDN